MSTYWDSWFCNDNCYHYRCAQIAIWDSWSLYDNCCWILVGLYFVKCFEFLALVFLQTKNNIFNEKFIWTFYFKYIADRWYICNACRRRFRFPNTLKAHILFHCHPPLTCLPPPISPSAICDFSQFPAVWPFTISPYGHNWKVQTPSPKFELYVKGNNGYTGIADQVGGHNGDCSATLERIFSKAVYRDTNNSQQIRHSSNDLHRCITLPIMHPVSSTNARLVQMKHKSFQIRNDYNNLPVSKELDLNKASDKVDDSRKQKTNSTCTNDYPNSTSSYNFDIVKSPEKASSQNDNKHLLSDVRETRTFGDNHKHGLSLMHSVRAKRVQKSERKNKKLKQEHSPSVAVVKTRSRHPCVFCGKMYSRRYGLTIHLRTHSGYKPLTCRVCARPFGDPSNLNKHIRLHATGETPYNCTHCGKVLVRRRDLERHIRSRHPNHLTALATVQPRLSSRSLCESMIAS